MTQLSPEEIQKQNDFDEEILPHLDALYGFARKLTSSEADAEDLVQDTIVKAYRFFNSYEKGTNAKGWLFRIMKNSYINLYRKVSKQPAKVDYDEIEPFYESIRSEQSNTTDMESTMFGSMMGDEITEALTRIPEDFRTVVLLCDVEGFSYEEIANMLDVPIGTIRSRLHRGRNLLKDMLADFATQRGY
ncbi:sigma-70 family RNA polymerase sigma factor [Balneolaceae bacterium ANBcel3]|nr:sigma-70 family RNA polymerase sigma factor [Balneolaceae bacterium ANBcel3]